MTGIVPNDLMGRILADAEQRTGVAADQLQVLSVEAVTWSDGSLDCPEPGMMYTQALVDGFQVVLDAMGTQLDYHASTAGVFILCQDGHPVP